MKWFTLACGVLFLGVQTVRAEEIDAKYRDTVKRGLDWVAKEQHRDGSWSERGQYPTTMTALSGMVLLMEGSTIKDGKYSTNVRKAVDWLTDPGRVQPNGLIGNPRDQNEAGRYMYGQGFAVLFLSCVYGEEEDAERRKKLETVLTKAVDFICKAQTNRGGWGYVSAADGNNFDEGSVTITQVQALRAARNAGIVVPKKAIDDSQEYLKKCTTPRGGIIYSLAHGGRAANGGERPPLTAAAVACQFSAGEYNSELGKKWIKYCQTAIPVGSVARSGHDEYTHYYYAQCLYMLGDDGFAKLFPEDKDKKAHLTWSEYKSKMYEHLKNTQAKDGNWTGGYIGPIFATTVYLTILQLDKATLPIYQR